MVAIKHFFVNTNFTKIDNTYQLTYYKELMALNTKLVDFGNKLVIESQQ